MRELTVYQELVEAGCDLDSHESDLYFKDTPEARRIVQEWESETGQSACSAPFVDEVEHTRWLDVPFAYQPFWESKRYGAGEVAGLRGEAKAA